MVRSVENIFVDFKSQFPPVVLGRFWKLVSRNPLRPTLRNRLRELAQPVSRCILFPCYLLSDRPVFSSSSFLKASAGLLLLSLRTHHRVVLPTRGWCIRFRETFPLEKRADRDNLSKSRMVRSKERH